MRGDEIAEATHKSTQVDSSALPSTDISPFTKAQYDKAESSAFCHFEQSEKSHAQSNKTAPKAESPTEIKLFDNLLFTDTFNTYTPDSKGFIGSKDGTQTTVDSLPYLEKNYAKIQEFKNTEFKIFMSNPPYSAGQKSANDDNANEKSPHIDKRISETYRAKSLATSTKNTSFDSFKRALRFMSDRIGESGGIIGLVVNGSFLDSNSDDGLRACLEAEFDYIYIFNLRGNQRTSGETSRKEGGKFFDSGSRTPVAICFFVKLDSSALPSTDISPFTKAQYDKAESSAFCHFERSEKSHAQSSDKPTPSKAKIYYYDIGDYLDRQTKLNIIQNFKSIESMEAQGLFTLITPNKDYDWINQRDYSFMAFTPMGSTGQKLKPLVINAKDELELEIFELFSQGVVTGKDNWSFNFSKENLAKNIALCIDTYNTEREALVANPAYKLCNDLSKVTWSGSLDKRVRANRELVFDESRIRICSYRPFTKEFLYFDNGYNHSHFQMDKIYPFGNKGEAIVCINGDFENVAIQVLGVGATHQFSALTSNGIVDLEHISKGHCFPLYYYERVESSTENGQMTMDYDKAESMDCHALPSTDISPFTKAQYDKAESSAFCHFEQSEKSHAQSSDKTRNDNKTAYYRRKDAIRDEALAFFQNAYNDSSITKEAMFYYIYAILNHKDYIAKYKDNLSKMLPRIPLMQDFWGFVASGRALAELHINYESHNKLDSGAFSCLAKDLHEFKTSAKGLFEKDFRQKAREDIEHLNEGDFRIETIKFHAKGVKDSILLNDTIAIVDIPHKAYAYKVNGKSAIEWILDRYKISTDKASGIVNDPNLYESTSGALKGLKGGRYVLELLLSVIQMSVQTIEVVESMPEYKLLFHNE
ncbi:type ISP restriction/modification enzyme [Helicobacter cinaedi]|uniref:type ISP restriction/modification enzyme n=1 Tax=Helicobacter cinaedi TaxID=213 RepID=UPI000CF0487D|nr:type ISP restriction/modification enzyme [Helicobacter cinaedi]